MDIAIEFAATFLLISILGLNATILWSIWSDSQRATKAYMTALVVFCNVLIFCVCLVMAQGK